MVRDRNQLLVAARELRSAHVIGIPAERGDPECAMRRICSRLAASSERRHVLVRDSDLAKGSCERLGAELRVPPRARLRTNVCKRLDIGPPQGRDELLDGPGPVTDGPNLHGNQCERLDG